MTRLAVDAEMRCALSRYHQLDMVETDLRARIKIGQESCPINGIVTSAVVFESTNRGGD